MKLVEIEENKYVNPELVFCVKQKGQCVEIQSTGGAFVEVSIDTKAVAEALSDNYTIGDCLKCIHDRL